MTVICVQCGAAYMGGEPFHGVNILKANAEVDHIDYYCAPCSDYLHRTLWPEEWGPYPGVPIPVATGRPS